MRRKRIQADCPAFLIKGPDEDNRLQCGSLRIGQYFRCAAQGTTNLQVCQRAQRSFILGLLLSGREVVADYQAQRYELIKFCAHTEQRAETCRLEVNVQLTQTLEQGHAPNIFGIQIWGGVPKGDVERGEMG